MPVWVSKEFFSSANVRFWKELTIRIVRTGMQFLIIRRKCDLPKGGVGRAGSKRKVGHMMCLPCTCSASAEGQPECQRRGASHVRATVA